MMILGIDNGYGYVKTASTISLNGVNKLMGAPAITDHVLSYEGNHYVIGEQRLPYTPDKTDSENHYLSTLAAIARELQLRGTNSSEVILAQGLPYEFYDTQREPFKAYMMQKKELKFNYENVKYQVQIKDVIVYPQCLPIICQVPGDGKKIGIDIGSGTVDVVVYLQNRLLRTESFTIPNVGTIYCMEKIKDAFVSKYNYKLDEWIIQSFMIDGKAEIDQEYIDFIEAIIKEYIAGIMKELSGRGIDSRFTKMVFGGGGAVLMKRYGSYNEKMVLFEENINANALGYETLTKAVLKKKQ